MHGILGVKHRMRAQCFVVRSSNFYFSSKYVRWLCVLVMRAKFQTISMQYIELRDEEIINTTER